jgi:hypothetical protein
MRHRFGEKLANKNLNTIHFVKTTHFFRFFAWLLKYAQQY